MTATAFLLAAGLGTRLRLLTLHRPKPLVPLLGAPLLDQAAALIIRHGITRAVVNAHYMAEQIVDWAASQDLIEVTVSREAPTILGTGGGLRQAMERLADPFVVVNGDILCDVDLGALLAAVPPGGAAMALRALRAGEGYGVVAGDASGRVVDLVGLAHAPHRGAVDRRTHFTGVHAMSRAALLHAGTWFDLGHPRRLPARQPGRPGRGARPADAVIWDRASVSDGAAVAAAIVHDGGVLCL